jgi:hypothetical protein
MSSLLIFKCPMSHGTMKCTLKAHIISGLFVKKSVPKTESQRLEVVKQLYTLSENWELLRFTTFYETMARWDKIMDSFLAYLYNIFSFTQYSYLLVFNFQQSNDNKGAYYGRGMVYARRGLQVINV